jgi:hypothetical protein
MRMNSDQFCTAMCACGCSTVKSASHRSNPITCVVGLCLNCSPGAPRFEGCPAGYAEDSQPGHHYWQPARLAGVVVTAPAPGGCSACRRGERRCSRRTRMGPVAPPGVVGRDRHSPPARSRDRSVGLAAPGVVPERGQRVLLPSAGRTRSGPGSTRGACQGDLSFLPGHRTVPRTRPRRTRALWDLGRIVPKGQRNFARYRRAETD